MNKTVKDVGRGQVTVWVEDSRFNYSTGEIWEEKLKYHRETITIGVKRAIAEAVADGREYRVKVFPIHEYIQPKPPHSYVVARMATVYLLNEEDAEIGDYLHPLHFGDVPHTMMTLFNQRTYYYHSYGWERVG